MIYWEETWSTRCSPWGHLRSAASPAASGNLLAISLFLAPLRTPCGAVGWSSFWLLTEFNMERKVWRSRVGAKRREVLTAFEAVSTCPNENTQNLELLFAREKVFRKCKSYTAIITLKSWNHYNLVWRGRQIFQVFPCVIIGAAASIKVTKVEKLELELEEEYKNWS